MSITLRDAFEGAMIEDVFWMPLPFVIGDRLGMLAGSHASIRGHIACALGAAYGLVLEILACRPETFQKGIGELEENNGL